MPRVLVLCPQARDRRAIATARLEERYRVEYIGEDFDAVEAFDPRAVFDAALARAADGIAATKDQSALLASAVAERRQLAGPRPAALLACQHKPTSRRIQRAVAPHATPRFALLDGQMPFAPPFFVKPVVGRLSQNAAQIDSQADLDALEDAAGYADRYAEIAAIAGISGQTMHGFLAEELLSGLEVTFEGYVHGGRVTPIGITDGVKYPGTISFERFEYPTRLSEERQAELAALAARIVAAHGLDDAFFNVEFFVPDEGRAEIIELNGRIASQFAPLVQRLHGRSTYEALFELACGRDPSWEPRPADGFGVSYVVRVFEDAFVEEVPEPADDVEILVRPGLRLSEQGLNDARSYRLAILYGFGETREEALAGVRASADALSFRLSQAVSPA